MAVSQLGTRDDEHQANHSAEVAPVALLRPRASPPRAPPPRWRRSASSAAPPGRATSRSRSSSAASATPTCTTPATSGAEPRLSHRAGPRDRRPGDRGRRRGEEVRPGDLAAVGLHGGLLPHLPRLQRRARAVLRERDHPDLQQPREADRPDDLRRLFRQDRRGPGLRPAGPGQAGPGRRGPAALRRHHHCTPRCGTGSVGAGSKVGIVGLGGLGHMGVKLAHALGAEVSLFTTSPDKAADAQAAGGRRGGHLP